MLITGSEKKLYLQLITFSNIYLSKNYDDSLVAGDNDRNNIVILNRNEELKFEVLTHIKRNGDRFNISYITMSIKDELPTINLSLDISNDSKFIAISRKQFPNIYSIDVIDLKSKMSNKKETTLLCNNNNIPSFGNNLLFCMNSKILIVSSPLSKQKIWLYGLMKDDLSREYFENIKISSRILSWIDEVEDPVDYEFFGHSVGHLKNIALNLESVFNYDVEKGILKDKING